MPVETANYINTLDPNLPATTDDVGLSDDHVRMIKRAIKATWPNITEPVTATAGQLNSPFPIRGIIDFFGAASEIPDGWALCDGRTVNRSDGSGTITTPDLRDRFTLCTGTLAVGTTGGSVALTASTSAAGGHTHSASTDAQGAHSHGGGTSAHALSGSELPARAQLHTLSKNKCFKLVRSGPTSRQGLPVVGGCTASAFGYHGGR